MAARGGGELVLDMGEVAGHQREEVTGLRVRIVPDGEVASARQIAGLAGIAVGQENGVVFL